MNPQDRLKELQRQIEAFKCGMEARYGKYWKDRADSTSLARYAEMIGKEKGYKQALDDAYRQINSIFKKHETSDADPLNKVKDIESDICDMFCAILGDEKVRQILTIPEEE